MVVLQTIFILLLVYYGLKILLKWLAPRLFNYAVKKTGERFGQPFGNPYDYQNNGKSHGATQKKKGVPKSNPSKKVGEYIDFEEIE